MVNVTDRSPLAILVDEVCAANGWSRREVARRAQAKGRSISASRIGQLLAEYPLGGIQADKVDDLAIGLGISRDRVAIAAVQAMGFRINDTTLSPAEAIRRDPALPQHTKEALLAILRTATTTGGGEHEPRRSAPIATSATRRPADVEAVRADLDRQLAATSTEQERARVQLLIDALDRHQAEQDQAPPGAAADAS